MNGEELVGSTTDIGESLVNEWAGISRSTTDIGESLVNECGWISRQCHRYR